MSTSFAALLIAAAQRHLGTRKKKIFSPSTALNLAVEILAVDCGLKSAFLYDLSTAGINLLQKYLQELQCIGWIQQHLHLLDIADNILLMNVEHTVSNLENALFSNRVIVVDVSAARTSPIICEPTLPGEIKGHISELLTHVTLFKGDKPGTVSVGEAFSPQWNLCTIFGLLLGYPTSYWFDTEKGFENCLTLTPLRVFTAQVSCPKISESMRLQIYSFSVPEGLHIALKEHLDAWGENLKHAFSHQDCFTDLCISSRVMTLPAVAL